MSEERTRILQLSVKDLKCIKEVDINEFGDITEIRGDAGQGKTSILEAIRAAIEGMDPAMVRQGASVAEIILDLDRVRINRKVYTDGSKDYLAVTDRKSNKPMDRAKDFLRTICGKAIFNPVEWVRLGGGENRGKTERLRAQRDQLLTAVPLQLDPAKIVQQVRALGEDVAAALSEVSLDQVDFGQHALVVCASITKACYDYRAIQNARAEDAENEAKLKPAPAGAVPREAAAVLQAKSEQATQAYLLAKAQAESRQKVIERRGILTKAIETGKALPTLESIQQQTQALIHAKANFETDIQQREAELQGLRLQLSQHIDRIGELKSQQHQIEVHQSRVAELNEINLSLEGAGSGQDLEQLGRAVRQAARDLEIRTQAEIHEAAIAKAAEARERAQRFDRLVELFRDGLPKQIVKEMAMPVAGLGVAGDCVTLEDIPLHQLGTSQQMRIGVAVAAALNPRTGFILVDGAESMGREDRKALAEAARQQGLQLILTVVDPDARSGPGVVVMRQGHQVTQ